LDSPLLHGFNLRRAADLFRATVLYTIDRCPGRLLRRSLVRRSVVLTLLLLSIWPTGLPAAATRSLSVTSPDFNGDGFADLAVGVPDEDVRRIFLGGAVSVLYGTGSGLSSAGNQFWHQDSPGIDGRAEVGDNFGEALVVGDFDGDGFTDLAAGVPDDSVGDVDSAGAVAVLYGSPAGLTATGDQFWSQDNPGILDVSEELDRFGLTLAAGDFDGDGFADLAVGVPEEDGDSTTSGAVNVLYGSAAGLSSEGNQFWTQDSPGILDLSESPDQFGDALAAADLDGDGFADLAVGVPFESVGTTTEAGAVNVLYGSAAGLSSEGNQFWTQDSPGILDVSESRDHLGDALAAADLDGDGFADLAAGVLTEDVDGVTNAGAVNVLYGTASGLSSVGNQFWHQNSTGIEGDAEEADNFGTALAAGDFDGDGFADLAAGVSNEGVGTADAAGSVAVLYGSFAGLTSADNQFWSQDNPGILDVSEEGDRLGDALATADFNGDGSADLAAGVPAEDVDGVTDSGAVLVLYGGTSGLSPTGDQFWHQNRPGIVDASEDDDAFGAGLTG
jgi:hypothetical protein